MLSSKSSSSTSPAVDESSTQEGPWTDKNGVGWRHISHLEWVSQKWQFYLEHVQVVVKPSPMPPTVPGGVSTGGTYVALYLGPVWCIINGKVYGVRRGVHVTLAYLPHMNSEWRAQIHEALIRKLDLYKDCRLSEWMRLDPEIFFSGKKWKMKNRSRLVCPWEWDMQSVLNMSGDVLWRDQDYPPQARIWNSQQKAAYRCTSFKQRVRRDCTRFREANDVVHRTSDSPHKPQNDDEPVVLLYNPECGTSDEWGYSTFYKQSAELSEICHWLWQVIDFEQHVRLKCIYDTRDDDPICQWDPDIHRVLNSANWHATPHQWVEEFADLTLIHIEAQQEGYKLASTSWVNVPIQVHQVGHVLSLRGQLDTSSDNTNEPDWTELVREYDEMAAASLTNSEKYRRKLARQLNPSEAASIMKELLRERFPKETMLHCFNCNERSTVHHDALGWMVYCPNTGEVGACEGSYCYSCYNRLLRKAKGNSQVWCCSAPYPFEILWV